MASADPGGLLRLLLITGGGVAVVGGRELFPGGGAVRAGHVGFRGEGIPGLLVGTHRVIGVGRWRLGSGVVGVVVGLVEGLLGVENFVEGVHVCF